MKNSKMHMIGNAHLDPVWLWQWQEGYQEEKGTFQSALDRLKEFPDFIFTSSSAALYEWIEQNDPAMFAEIQARVKEGRWVICNGWWIQPDCNIPSGESFARHSLIGQRYFKEKLGVTAVVGYNVDSFGHHGMLPQILRLSGMDYYVFMRPHPHEMGLPGPLFWWESDDGSRVLTYRIPFEYTTWSVDIEAHVRRCAAEIKAPFAAGMCFYGVGNHGGGPTIEQINCIKGLQGDPNLPELVFSDPNAFFASIKTDELAIPAVHSDLQHHASGCYAAHSGVKRWNRRAENTLLAAEKWSAVANLLTGLPYPGDFQHAWKQVLFNQFHDIMAGTSIEAAYEDARDTYGEANAIAARALNHATQSISWRINIPKVDGMKPIVVFNPHAWASKIGVELEWGRLPADTLMLDDQDQEVAVQAVQSTATSNGRNRLSFVADLPALGYRTFRIMPRPTEAPAVLQEQDELLDGEVMGEDVQAEPGDAEATPQSGGPLLDATDTTLENSWFRLEFDGETGFIKSLIDKSLNLELFRDVAARPVVIDDPSDTWSHNVLLFNKVIGDFKATSVKLVAKGAVKAIVRVVSSYGSSRLVQDFALYRDLPQIEVRAMVDWNEHFKMLKLQFPLNLNFMKATYEIPFGHIERPVNGEEEPAQTWVDVTGIVRASDQTYGLSLLNDSKYSFDVNNKVLRMTVLRSPIYAHHDPLVPDPDGHYSFIDQGIQHFKYWLLPHAGSWEQAGTVKRAAELNQPPVAVIETYHEHGGLPQSASFLEVDQDNVVVSAVKQAEDGDTLIVRLYETTKVRTAATIRLPQWKRDIAATFGPCEIKTFRIPRDQAQPVVEVNLLEWEK